MLREAFGDLEILELASYDAVIEEGAAHRGMSALIDWWRANPGKAGPRRAADQTMSSPRLPPSLR